MKSSGIERSWRAVLATRRTTLMAGLALVAIVLHLILRWFTPAPAPVVLAPLWVALLLGGLPLVWALARKAWRREFGADLLGGVAIVTAVVLGEYLAGAIIVLMLAGGDALESYALGSASSVLSALAKRVPAKAHRQDGTSIVEVALPEVRVGDTLIIYPHEICPVDGVVLAGHGVMDESYLTGEPFQMTKTTGSTVISGAVNGEAALTIRATQRAADSRYARIMAVMQDSESHRPRLRRLGDLLGAWYTPLALLVAGGAWAWSGEATRFLAVLVIATPCPLLIAIPISIVGAISLCARRAIIVKNPVVLEQVAQCRTAIFDKTGTLTYGDPAMTELVPAPGVVPHDLLALLASLERYSKHPLARAIVAAGEADKLPQLPVVAVSEAPGKGLRGEVAGKHLRITSRNQYLAEHPEASLPAAAGGLECLVLVENQFAALLRFRDAPRTESRSFINHLRPHHHFDRVMLLSGDRQSEVQYLADQVGISEVHAQASPEEKLTIVRRETALAKTLYVGDGINDAPAMMAATVAMALGHHNEVTSAAAGVVVMDNSLKKVDEFMHISRRMRVIALQSAVGGMALSLIGMGLAFAGILTPVTGAIAQEVIDILAVFNALRAALPPKVLSDL